MKSPVHGSFPARGFLFQPHCHLASSLRLASRVLYFQYLPWMALRPPPCLACDSSEQHHHITMGCPQQLTTYCKTSMAMLLRNWPGSPSLSQHDHRPSRTEYSYLVTNHVDYSSDSLLSLLTRGRFGLPVSLAYCCTVVRPPCVSFGCLAFSFWPPISPCAAQLLLSVISIAAAHQATH